MSIDLEQLKRTFLEESFEGLEIMEQGIIKLDLIQPDAEEINTIFRGIHSIKGGAGTFGFNEISELAHTFENILDEIRNNKRKLTIDISDIFLSSIDALNSILNSYQSKEDIDEVLIQNTTNQLNAISGTSNEESKLLLNNPNNDNINKIEITFQPEPNILECGNEPIRILRELANVSDLSLQIDEESIPTIDDDLTKIKLSWKATLTGDDIDLNDAKEVFEWVEDDCIVLTFKTSSTKLQTHNTQLETKQITAPKIETKASSLRVDTQKIDILVNLVGELVITQSMLGQFNKEGGSDLPKFEENLSTLNRQMRELQEAIITVRMVPVSTAFNRIPRIIRDTSKNLNKKIQLEMSGENTEVDKTVSEKLTDPLVHIIRNAVDHGIELPEKRVNEGKSETGIIIISAYHQGGNLLIDIEDDGNGVDTEKVKQKAIDKGIINQDSTLSNKEIDELIFAPGFSTADVITDVSGRGVGMDVVKRNIESLKGSIELYSNKGKGSKFRIKVPLTLAILDGQLARIGNQTFVLPILSILESIQIEKECIKTVQGHSSLYKLREEYIPIVDLFDKFKIKNTSRSIKGQLLVIVEHNRVKTALRISELLTQQQVVIKNLEQNFMKLQGFSGATILGDGTVSLILDIPSIVDSVSQENNNDRITNN
jgi:two-component system chemotaxis sensor kinase CheA